MPTPDCTLAKRQVDGDGMAWKVMGDRRLGEGVVAARERGDLIK
jgi:hypothetical protein